MNRIPLRRLLLAAALLCSLPAVQVQADTTILIDDFKQGPAAGWQEKKFVGRTEYTAAEIDGVPCLRAESRGSASGLFFELDLDPQNYPLLSWSWRVENTLAKGDETRKQGDDYAARIYVVFPSFFFWKTRALNYIWANQLAQGEALPSPYTGNDILVAVQSGAGRTGQWVHEQRNIVEDFRKYFGEEPPRIGAIAIMTDTDNTGEQAVACYGPIMLHGNPPEDQGDTGGEGAGARSTGKPVPP